MNRWWDGVPHERYWLEITDRPDIGVDLKAPQTKDNGQEYWGYSLIKEAQDTDIVFHYHSPTRAIVACSKVVGETWDETIIWAAHGTVARDAGVVPYRRPGWRRGLEGLAELRQPLTLGEIRPDKEALRQMLDRLARQYGTPLYFPFEVSEKRPPRAIRAYLN